MKNKIILALLLPVVVGIALVAFYAYIAVSRSIPLADPSEWGSFGDYLGGLLNPVVGITTLYLLIKTLLAQQTSIDLQTKELGLQRKELALQRLETARATETMDKQNQTILRQSLEQSLFSWLSNYRDQVDRFIYDGVSGVAGMKDYFKNKLRARVLIFRSQGSIDQVEMLANSLSKNKLRVADDKDSHLQVLLHTAIKTFASDSRDTIPGIRTQMRVLYRLILWIDSTPGMNQTDRWHYVGLIRAQLTDAELTLLLFNGLTANGKPFAKLANKYALFDNLESEDALVQLIQSDYFVDRTNQLSLFARLTEPFPYTDSAFHSTVAKQNLKIGDYADQAEDAVIQP